MHLPPGPRAPAAWQTVGWTVRPAAFLRRVHERFGDPVTVRTYWMDEPLVLDGEEHLRERRLIQTPFHGERMRAFRPAVAELARAELGTWSGRVVTLERMKHLTLETILRIVFGARGEQEAAELRDAVQGTLDTVRSMPRMLAMSLVQRDLGPRSPWGRFRIAVERFDELLLDVVARRRA